jgi:hypothetical protein
MLSLLHENESTPFALLEVVSQLPLDPKGKVSREHTPTATLPISRRLAR